MTPPRLHTALATLVSVAVAAASLCQELPFTHFTPETGPVTLPSASVQTVYQDRLGYIWLGFFSSGIARYDGHSLELFGLDDGLVDLTVREVTEDASGHLWVTSEAGLVVSTLPLPEYSPGQPIRFESTRDGIGLVSTRLRHNWIATAPDGSVWVVTAGDEIHRYLLRDSAPLEHMELSPPASGTHLANARAVIAVLRDERVAIAREDGSLGFLDQGQLDGSLVPVTPPPDPASAILEASDGTIWVGCEDGTVGRLGAAGFETVSRQLAEHVNCIVEAHDGALWVTTLGNGVLRIDPTGNNDGEHFTRRHGLPSETVWQVMEDREGNLWFAHNAGLSRLRSNWRAFSHYTGASHAGGRPVLPEPTVFTVEPWSAGRADSLLWVGTGGGLAAIARSGESTALTVADGLSSNSVYALERDPDGRIWVGTLDGLDVIAFGAEPVPGEGTAPRRLRALDRAARITSFARGTIYGLHTLPLSNGAGQQPVFGVWVCGANGLACRLDGEWHDFDDADGLPPAGTTSVAVDASGHVWLGTQASGVYRSTRPVSVAVLRAHPSRAHRSGTPGPAAPMFEPYWTRSQGAPSNHVPNLVWAGGRMWVATGSSLCALPATSVLPDLCLDEASGLGGNRVRGMAVHPVSGTLWVTQNRGLTEIAPATGEVLRQVSKRDGLVDNEAWVGDSLAIDAAGVVYMATPSGLSLYRPEADRSDPPPPLLRFRSIDLSQDDWGHNQISLHWAALGFADEAGTRFRTRLVGYDTDWSGITDDVRIRYTNLPAVLLARTYTFEVAAVTGHEHGTVPPLQHSFRIRPAWYLRWWAVAMWAVGFVLSAAAFNARRNARLRRRARHLETEVDARTSEITYALAELEALDEIVQAINREVDFDRLMSALLDYGIALVPGARSGLFLLPRSGRSGYQIAAVTGQCEAVEGRASGSVNEGQVAELLATSIPIAEGLQLSRGPVDLCRLVGGGDGGRSAPLLSASLPGDGGAPAVLVFEIAPDQGAPVGGEVRTLERYRRHAITALDKARTLRDLKIASREATQASAAKSAFLATMSHELRTPLNSIIGFAEILINRGAAVDSSRARTFLDNILSSGRHLLALINDILDLSKIEAGRMELVPSRTDLPALMEGVRRVVLGMASKRQIHIRVEFDPGLESVVIDAAKVKQILYNLLSNAVKFSPEGSEVSMRAQTLGPGDGDLNGPAVQLAVTDRGIGIADEDREAIFEEFRQLDARASRSYAGSGLGLALVRRLVELHGGRIELVSAPDRGSTFTVVLPVDRVPP